jgi:LysM repeat protein
LRSYRYASHAAVLLVAALISGYTTLTNSLGPGAARAAFDVQAATDAGRFGDVAMGRDSIIIKPISVPLAAIPSRRPIDYTVAAGDTLVDIAEAHQVSLRDVLWSNPGLRLPLVPGQSLFLPPVPGAVVVVRAGQTAESIADAYGVDPTIVLGYNDIRAGQLTPGRVLVIPVDSQTSPNLDDGRPADPRAPGQLLCPIQAAPVIQRFGPTNFALEPPYAGYPHFHTGVDLLAQYGTPIDAAAGGRVTATGSAPYFGIRVEVTDSYGMVEVYAHMSAIAVNVGDEVQQGERVGFVGSTGLSIGPHLHFQLEVGGAPTDPMPLVGC